MAYLGLNFKVSKHSKNKNDYGTTLKLFYAKKGLKNLILKKDKLLKSGGNANFKKASLKIFNGRFWLIC